MGQTRFFCLALTTTLGKRKLRKLEAALHCLKIDLVLHFTWGVGSMQTSFSWNYLSVPRSWPRPRQDHTEGQQLLMLQVSLLHHSSLCQRKEQRVLIVVISVVPGFTDTKLKIISDCRKNSVFFLLLDWYYLPTPPLGQDMTQGQFLSGV